MAIKDGPIVIPKITAGNMIIIILIEGEWSYKLTVMIDPNPTLFSDCPVPPNTSPKDSNYVHGYPKPAQLSPVLRNNHLHYNNEAAGIVFFSLH